MNLAIEHYAEDNAYVTAKRKEPKDKKIYVQVLLEQSMLKAIDDTRRAEVIIPSRTETIRRLIDIGLKHSKKPTK